MRVSRMLFLVVLICLVCVHAGFSLEAQNRRTPRELGITIGTLPVGSNNAITDVTGVRVGHFTLNEGANVRTGITIVMPHLDNLFQNKVPAGIFVGNGFGKLAGYTQVEELGSIETPIAITNTLSVGAVMEGLVRYTLTYPGNRRARSVNAVVGEINDGYLNDIRGLHIRPEHVLDAIDNAGGGDVSQGCVGAGMGARTLGYKSGIGTASRKVRIGQKGYTLGVLVCSNFGTGSLIVDGVPIGHLLAGESTRSENADQPNQPAEEGSAIIVVATDAPLEARNLKRLAARAMLGLGKVGGFSSNGSGEYIIAFSTAVDLRTAPNSPFAGGRVLGNDRITPLFAAVIETTEEAILNSIFLAETTRGRNRHVMHALPLDPVLKHMRRFRHIGID